MKKFKILALVMTCAILLSSIMIPVSADEPNNNTPAITIDGVADEAIWENPAATYELKYFATSSSCGATSSKVDEDGISTVKFAYDADYLYVCFESTNGVRDDKQGYLRLQIRPDASKALNKGNYSTNYTGESMQLTVNTNIKNATTDKTYYWNVPDQTSTSSLLNAFNPSVSTSSAFTAEHDVYKNTQIALTTTTTKQDFSGTEYTVVTSQTLEIKIPLAESYKTALKTTLGGADLYIGLREYAGSDSAGVGYYGSHFATEEVDGSYCNSGKVNHCTKLNLPALNDAKTAIEFLGFQSRTNEEDNTKYDVRFVSVVDDYTGFDTNASKLGYLFTNAEGQTSTQYCSKIYTELNVSNGTIKASDFGGTYFFCFTIMGLDQNATEAYALNVKCFTQKDAEAEVEYCLNPVDVKISYDAENSKAVFN